jgi:hypothetical protein
LQDPPKFTQIGIFGLKTNYLATLVLTLSLLKKQSLNLLAVRVMAFFPQDVENWKLWSAEHSALISIIQVQHGGVLREGGTAKLTFKVC